MRSQKIIMGTGVTIDIPAGDRELIKKVFNLLTDIDNKFSPYKSESEVSKYARGELPKQQLSRDLSEIIEGCRLAEIATDGAFSAYATGNFDPSGYVKGWAIDKAAKLIKKVGIKNFCISVGGDIWTSSDGIKIWSVGVQHPMNSAEIIAILYAKNLTIATSGSYERGDHIINPINGKAANSLLSVTVVGPNIITADVLSTALFVQGELGLNFIESKNEGYDALIICRNERIKMTKGFKEYLTS